MSYHQHPPSALTKVFVGGLAWETETQALRDHFNKFGDIIEAVIITDKLTGRSKGYGFVTFKEPAAAKKACEDSAPVINGRKGNCNIASLRPRKISPPPHSTTTYSGGAGGGGSRNGAGGVRVLPAVATTAVHWYVPAGAPPSLSTMPTFHQHYAASVFPYNGTSYGYSPYFLGSTNVGYRTKVNHSGAGGAYLPGQFSYPAQAGMVAPIAVTPMYHPMHEFHQNHHLHHSMGGGGTIAAAHFFQPATALSYSPAPATHISKFPVVPPNKC